MKASGIDPLNYMHGIVSKLFRHERDTGMSAAYRATASELRELSMHPRWRDEAPDSGTAEEFFIRYARAFGLHASTDTMGGLHFRRTAGPIDEATITWPGKRNE